MCKDAFTGVPTVMAVAVAAAFEFVGPAVVDAPVAALSDFPLPLPASPLSPLKS